MRYNRRNLTLAILAAGAMAVSVACGREGAGTADTGLAMGPDAGMPGGMTDTDAMSPAPVLNDANIVYLLDEANRADSAAGAIASTKGTNSEVREFGARMVRDHHDLRRQGRDLASRLGVSPVAPPGDASRAQSDRALSMLNSVARGRDFDRAYIEHEIDYHKTVLETATAAMAAAQNAELKNLIQKAAPVIQGHLDLAQAIQGRLQ